LDLTDRLCAHCISAKIKFAHQNTRQELSRTRTQQEKIIIDSIQPQEKNSDTDTGVDRFAPTQETHQLSS
jgi:hypothetical protein